jgi:type I restriction enzyme, R subunit
MPALHTTQIFGTPIYTYSYCEAVIDGYLVDHKPPIQINSELSRNGIVWRIGEEIRRRKGVLYEQENGIPLFMWINLIIAG